MPYITSKHREEFLAVKIPGGFFDRRKSNWLDSQYFVEDSEGQKYVRPGLIVAQNTATYKWVPYNLAASYGAGSDGTNSKLGILDTFEIVTLGDEAVAPLYHGKVIEEHCYVFGNGLDSITAAVKTALPDIEWQ
ncbi:hypothetical protein GF395_04395 [Candidatus Uhrbacteria bacterium]|nr:hypothetical protein [Candidatus Uhrbacteria bacterium]